MKYIGAIVYVPTKQKYGKVITKHGDKLLIQFANESYSYVSIKDIKVIGREDDIDGME